MRRTAVLLSTLALVLGVAPATASAAQPPNCNGKTMVYPAKVSTSSEDVGAIHLCREGDNYFAMYINYGLMPRQRWAQGWLYRFDENGNHSEWSCDSPVGEANGHVQAGDTWCRTPSIRSTSPDVHFQAGAKYYVAQDNQYVIWAEAYTRICNKSKCI